MKLLGNRILVRHQFKNKSDGGIHMPDGSHIQAMGSRVVAVGTHPDIPEEIKPGVQIVISPFAGMDFEWEGEVLKEVKRQDILAVVTESQEPVLSIVGSD